MEIVWHGTASVELRTKEGKILFDPFVPLKGSPVDIGVEEFDGFDEIFITHGHLDHIASLPSVYKRNPNIRIRCTKTPYRTLRRKGIPKENLVLINFGDEISVFDFKIRILHGKHARLPRLTAKLLAELLSTPSKENLPYLLHEHTLCKERGETVFYDIEAEGKRISLIGSLNSRNDTEYPTESDLLVLPYNGWTDNFPPASSVIERLRPKRVLLDHYDVTFPPATREINLAPILEKYGDRVQPLVHRKVEIL